METSFSEEQALIRWGCDLSMLFETLSKGKFVCYSTELFWEVLITELVEFKKKNQATLVQHLISSWKLRQELLQ